MNKNERAVLESVYDGEIVVVPDDVRCLDIPMSVVILVAKAWHDSYKCKVARRAGRGVSNGIRVGDDRWVVEVVKGDLHLQKTENLYAAFNGVTLHHWFIKFDFLDDIVRLLPIGNVK